MSLRTETGRTCAAVRLHAVQDGPAAAPVLVLGPSLGTELGMFDAQVRDLADTFHVVRFDLRGHGGSPVIPGPYTVADMAADVVALLDDLGIDQFCYAGVSLGGAIGQQLALTVPDRLRRLVVVVAAARFPDPASWQERADRVRTEGTQFLVSSRVGAWVTESFGRSHAEETERLLDMLRRTPPEGYAACCETLASFDLRTRLPDVPVPTLVIAGARDPATPVDTVREIADAMPCARFVVVPDAAHLVSVERPDAVDAEIRQFLS
jgi:3-oxoadipate enol-lactonase